MKKFLSLLLPALLLCACGTWHMNTADNAYDRMGYAKANAHYEKAFASMKDTAERAAHREQILRNAYAYQLHNDLRNAATWYAEAERMAPLDAEADYHYGEVLMGLNRYEEAEPHFESTLNDSPEHAPAQDLLFSSQQYDEFYKDSTRYTISVLPIPGVVSAFSAVPYKDGLVFVGEQDPGLKSNDPWNGMSFLDIYFSQKHTLVNWEKAEPIPGDVNDRYHEGPCAFTADGNTMYFTRSNYYKYKLQKDAADVSHLKMFRAQLDANGKWSDIREFPFNGETFSVGHPALSTDGNTLYFASDMAGSLGGSDIWCSVNNGTGWEAPKNLGPTINTPGNELFPTVVGKSLYFSSTAHQNMGGLDIFETHPEGDGWSEPVNMDYPINTPHDDLSFVMNPDGKSGYLSSDRSGVDRIYTFFLNDPVFMLDGVVADDSTGRYLPQAEARLTNLITDEELTTTTGTDGKFSFKLAQNTPYELRVERNGMLTQSRVISTEGLTDSRSLRAQFRLQPFQVNKIFALKNIYFDYDKWDIRPDAAIELDKLVRFINDNPTLVFELSSHTDSRGDDIYNLVLSDARANSTVDYLIRHGVPADRVLAHGYGETMLVNRCSNGVLCSEEEHQANRRTEIKILRKDVASVTP